jgi:hypothetical protein
MASDSQPRRTFFKGEEYVSVLGLAQMLGVSTKTVRRLEQRGVLDRPEGIPRGVKHQRWYRMSDLEAIREAIKANQDRGLGHFRQTALRRGTEHKTPRRQSWSELDAIDEDERPTASADAVAPVLCPRCDSEIVFVTQAVPGGGLAQLPWCERCGGTIDLHVPEPVEGSCVRCGGEVVWELREPGQGFVPVCGAHGVTQVHEKKGAPQAHWASFPALTAPSGARRRGLSAADVVGAIRQPRRPERSQLLFLDPY